MRDPRHNFGSTGTATPARPHKATRSSAPTSESVVVLQGARSSCCCSGSKPSCCPRLEAAMLRGCSGQHTYKMVGAAYYYSSPDPCSGAFLSRTSLKSLLLLAKQCCRRSLMTTAQWLASGHCELKLRKCSMSCGRSSITICLYIPQSLAALRLVS